ncbi:pentapeptide repeat-containing protein [Hassallia byssoidea VB512170]|uniref:Pentapeptide repeat-containing protein n=1 Tax=Hassallia byssoidea VB512170 TaxID=1304833 RepID=A0A846HKN2_9CYAN|nr:pentapeptide repeat-containing protein [Hassalia byssoidea]NEU77208.1 pentapeptide repeat-containing protein [Hassalia byssoidea VB512170]
MTDSSLARKKKKITYTASTQGIERAENALKRLGFESKSNFAESQLLSRSTVTKFFQCQPIQLDSFKRICKALKLNWAEVAGIIEEGQSQGLEINSYSSPDTDEMLQVEAVQRQVTVIDKQSKKLKAVIVLEGDINSVNSDLKVSLELALLTYPGDTIKITDIKAGSIRLIVEGSQEEIERLVSRIKLGELKELRGFPVEDIQVLNENSDDEESDELNDKWHLVQEIVNQAVTNRNLSNADLSDAYLSDAYLSDADLSDADLSDADLSDADLRGADLNRANLIGANLINAYLSDAYLGGADLIDAYLGRAYLGGANLIGADLSRANLSRANLSGADLSRANLSNADLSDAYLSDAYLSDADLSGANLSGANLSGANLSRANLSRANLSRADLSGANVENARFGNNQGISEARKRDLIQKGAIFEDSHGDRSGILLSG